jgi:hypothetical protein
MANPEHLAILKRGIEEGIEVWNKWRRENMGIIPDLSAADLSGANLSDVYFWRTDLDSVNLSGANLLRATFAEAILRGSTLIKADLREVTLIDSNLIGANLSQVDLGGAELAGTNFRGANLIHANLSETDLGGVDFSEADLREASLINAQLSGTNLTRANLDEANFQGARLAQTNFANTDLSTAKNLHLVRHLMASTIGIDTLYKSGGNIPREFLEGCGLKRKAIEFANSLVNTKLDYFPSFISHSFRDEEFVNLLFERMKREDLRVWKAPENMRGGRTIDEQVLTAIHGHDKFILVLSEASMNSDWVKRETLVARAREINEKKQIIFPIRICDMDKINSWTLIDSSTQEDVAHKVRLYFVPDFSQWKDYDKFNAEFEKLLKALRAGE